MELPIISAKNEVSWGWRYTIVVVQIVPTSAIPFEYIADFFEQIEHALNRSRATFNETMDQ